MYFSLNFYVTLLELVVSTIPSEQVKERNRFAQSYILAFLQGYLRYNNIDEYWINCFDLFFQYRRICTYRFVKYLSEKSANNSYESYCKNLRDQILQKKEFVPLDLSEIKSLISKI